MEKIVLLRDETSRDDTFINLLKILFPETEIQFQIRNTQPSHISKQPSWTDIIEEFSKHYLGG